MVINLLELKLNSFNFISFGFIHWNNEMLFMYSDMKAMVDKATLAVGGKNKNLKDGDRIKLIRNLLSRRDAWLV